MKLFLDRQKWIDYFHILYFCRILTWLRWLLNLISFLQVAIPTVNPECQSLADIINDVKRRLDQVPLSLLPIPGLNTSLPTTLTCYEYPSCTGFNCSGSVYGTHLQFSFNFDYCLKPISANISVRLMLWMIIYSITFNINHKICVDSLIYW